MRCALLALAAVFFGHASLHAEPAPGSVADAQRAEAAERFDHAMRLIDEGDDAAAVAELRRVDEIAPHPRVLYNLGLAYAALNRPVDAVATLDRLLAAPGALPRENLRIARVVRDEQARRTATLEITTSVPASIEIDGIDVGKTPLAKPVMIAAGTRLVAALSAGYLPARREITVAGETTQRLALDLAPSELRLAHLAIHTAVPDAEVLVDGQRVGRTPLPGSIAVPPGRRVVELRRPGYRSERREVAVDDGATGELAFDLAEDPTAPSKGGRLVLAVSGSPTRTSPSTAAAAWRLPRAAAAAAGRAPAENRASRLCSTSTARSTYPRTPKRRSR